MRTAVLLAGLVAALTAVVAGSYLHQWVLYLLGALGMLAVGLVAGLDRVRDRRATAAEVDIDELRGTPDGRQVTGIRDTRGEVAAIRRLRKIHRGLSVTAATELVRKL